jgi:hypothetical protein
MPYVSKAERERAEHRKRWMTLTEAIAYVRLREQCSVSIARQQLVDALADLEIPVEWADVEPPTGADQQPETKGKPAPLDKGEYAEYRIRVISQREELRAARYRREGIEAITRLAWQKRIALGQEISLQFAAKLFEIDHPPPPLLGSRFSVGIDKALILGVRAFWRETRYRRGKVFDLTCDRWRVPLLERAAVQRCWPSEGHNETLPIGSQAAADDACRVIAAEKRLHSGGRPSSKRDIYTALEALLSEKHHVRTMGISRVADMVARHCGKSVGERGWSLRTVQQHIQTWRAIHCD